MEVNLNIEKKDISLVKEYLEDKHKPVGIDEVTLQIAYFKTQDDRKNKVKIYNPNCEYKVGDLIYKVYQGKIPVGAKKTIDIDGGVVLKVVDVKVRFGLTEIKLDYEGTSDFRKYIKYLERQKIELLLPHKQEKSCEKVTYLDDINDPRSQQEPLVKKDFNALKKRLVTVCGKETDIIFNSGKVLLEKNLKEIAPEVFDKIREFLTENKKSESTEFLVENFAKIKSDNEDFDPFCFALNFRMQKDYKIDFQQVNTVGWGKWNLISVIYYLKKDSLVSEENPLLSTTTFQNKKNLSQKRKQFEDSIFGDDHTRYFLTQREVSSGALKLRSSIYNCGEFTEIEAVDTATKKIHTLYYYDSARLILGFKDLFSSYKALQGMIINFEHTEEGNFHFTVRTTKKGTIADKVKYDPEKKTFQISEEKVASPVFVSKSIFLESEVFNIINEKMDEFRKVDTYNNLVHKVFLEFGLRDKNYEIHFLRLYHILDFIFPVDQRMLEEVILSNPEFIPSDKIPGLFYLDSDAVLEIEEEEKIRRIAIVEERKQAREDLRIKKAEEELKAKEEIRRVREERRRKREEEMRMKEKMKEEREQRKVQSVSEKPERSFAGTTDSRTRHDQPREYKKKIANENIGIPVEPVPEKKAHAKKVKRKEEVERDAKVKKKVERKPVEEVMDLEEIKKEIKLEELKEKVLDKKKKDKTKKTEFAFKDNGGFGGIFASKLDNLVKPEDEEKEIKKKTTKKSEK